MKKWMVRLVLAFVVLLCVLSLSTKFFLSKEFLVEEIEDSINSRVQIGRLDVSFFSIPSKVTLKDVILAERGSAEEMALDYTDRKPLSKGVIELEQLSFEVSLWELISKKIHVDSFVLKGMHARMTLFENGKNSLDPLFGKPAEKEKSAEKEKPSKKSPPQETTEPPVADSKSFNAKEKEEFVTELKSVKISDVSIDLLIEKTGLLVQASEGSFELNDIRIDPNALEVVNQATLRMEAKFEVFDSASKVVKYGELGLSGVSQTKLFDPKTGDVDPDVDLDLTISEDSYINSKVPYVEKVWNTGKKLEKYGVNIGSLPDKAYFGRSRKLAGSYKRGRVDLTKDVSVMIHDWEIAVNENAWFDSGNEQHDFRLDVSASQKSSSSITKRMDRLLRKLPREVRGSFADNIKNDWLLNGRLTLKLHTSEKLSSPKVKILTKLPSIDDQIKDYAKDKALDFLKKKLKF